MSTQQRVVSAHCRKGQHWACFAKAGAPAGPFATRCDCQCHRERRQHLDAMVRDAEEAGLYDKPELSLDESTD